MSTSTPAVNRVPVARQTFRAPVAEVYAALIQTLHFSAGFDVVANDDVTHSVRFRLPNDNGEYEARVIADGMYSAVIINTRSEWRPEAQPTVGCTENWPNKSLRRALLCPMPSSPNADSGKPLSQTMMVRDQSGRLVL